MKILWKGYISFGLINIPIRLHTAYKGTGLHFKLLDSRDKTKIRYKKINEKTGEEVPKNNVAKAYQVSKNQYILVKDEDSAPKSSTNINVEMFVGSGEISPIYLDNPYYLIPDGGNSKAYVLFREVLRRVGKVAIAKITIRTREHIATIYPFQDILVLQLLRFAQDFVKISELDFPQVDLAAKQLDSHELELACKLLEYMTRSWQPEVYHDETKERMLALIKKLAKTERYLELPEKEAELIEEPQQDIASLLEKSIPQHRQKPSKYRRAYLTG